MCETADIAISDWRELELIEGQIAAWWLGQAGFLFRTTHQAFIVDPYLSDSLAHKYRDAKFKHIRMMPIPVSPDALTDIDCICSSHRHSDHMDIGTLPGLLAANPACRYFCPKSAMNHATDVLGIDKDVMTPLDEGDHLQLATGIELDVIASAHEQVEYDSQRHCLYLGFIFNVNGTKVYHCGDCIPYDGLAEKLNGVDIAFLPVNGRDAYRQSNGVPGNFTFEEAVDLCREAGIRTLVPHHFGMFDFNTVDIEELRVKVVSLDSDLRIIIPEIDKALVF